MIPGRAIGILKILLLLGIKMKSKIMILLWQIMFMLNILWEILFFVINDLELAEELKQAKSLYTIRALSHFYGTEFDVWVFNDFLWVC